ncbi:MAG TPA: hypothetical protein VEH06_15270 [Candidatus Bathyarchaeia archaeon]|nr:hypothetical protein [Candidatus Bathyarchaeia archaeon]
MTRFCQGIGSMTGVACTIRGRSDGYKVGAQFTKGGQYHEAESKIAMRRLLPLSLFLFEACNEYDVRRSTTKIKLNKPACRLGAK